jgi:hypothetical protein
MKILAHWQGNCSYRFGRHLGAPEEEIMKSLIRTLGIFVVALSLGIFLGPRVESMVQLTGAALQGQVQSGSAQLQSSLDAAAPGVASHLATLLIVLGAIMLSTLISLVIFVPLRIHSMKREIRAQREEIQSMKSEIHLSSELLMDARRNYRVQEHEKKESEPVRPSSGLRQWVAPRRAPQHAKDPSHN